MKKNILLLLVISTTFCAKSQNIVTSDTLVLNDVIVFANKFPEHQKKIAQTIGVIKDKQALNYQANCADVLINSGSVFVQKSQQGGGSPIIRGFEASRILLMVDGIRMNNAIYRAGHLQNIITIDNMILDRMEVLYGPSSTMYGSDALGGVISMFTKNPMLSSNNKTQITGNAVARFATAIEETRGHVDFNIGSKKWVSLTSITYGKFGDVTQGNQRSSDYPDFGKKTFYVERINNTDSAFENSDPNKQKQSGYNQTDFTQKILFQPKENVQHIANIQISNSSDIPRYDRLTEQSVGKPIFAEWNYGPQMRSLIAYHFNATKMIGFINSLKVTASYQDVEESRITRRFKNNNRDSRIERVNIFGITIDALHNAGKNEFQFGIESNINYVNSKAQRENIVTNNLSKISTRYADGPTKMSYSAAYIQHILKITNHLTLNDGLRINAVRLDARFIDTSLLHLPFTQVIQKNIAVTGNIGLVYVSPKNLRIAVLVNSGFRSPNVDDLTKVFDTKTGYVVVPNRDIKSEYTYNTEVNFSHTINNFSYGASMYYTWFTNAIVVDKYNFNGVDSMNFQGIKSAIYAPQNKAKAYIYGYTVHAAYNITKNTKAEAVYSYTFGNYTNNVGNQYPLDHIPPAYGKLSITHKQTNWFAQATCLYNSWKRIENYNPNGEDNEQYATKDGMPSWMTINVHTGYNFSKAFAINFSVENIFDKNYRYFASGISAPGRNFVVSLVGKF
jgi:hemoglobin/transferrin/lactoferrin receptor protein